MVDGHITNIGLCDKAVNESMLETCQTHRISSQRREDQMSKGQDAKKNDKKQPAKTIKEKKQEKKKKKEKKSESERFAS
jgi:hypothetical protein